MQFWRFSQPLLAAKSRPQVRPTLKPLFSGQKINAEAQTRNPLFMKSLRSTLKAFEKHFYTEWMLVTAIESPWRLIM
jgi:hypothetical protein